MPNIPVQGRRVYPPEYTQLKTSDIEPGDYWKDESMGWMCRSPIGGPVGSLRAHDVTEHEDKTITVHPSILITGYDEEKKEDFQYHGYLQKGVWYQV